MRKHFRQNGDSMRFVKWLAVGALIAGALCGCSASTTKVSSRPAPDRSAAQAAGLEDILVGLEPQLDAEPKGDAAAGGTYLCRIVGISADVAPAVVSVDLITAAFPPGTSVQDRERSSWPDRWGWNRFKHVQRLSLAYATLAGTRHAGDLVVMTPKRFAATWEARRDWNYYIQFGAKTEVTQLWAWTY